MSTNTTTTTTQPARETTQNPDRDRDRDRDPDPDPNLDLDLDLDLDLGFEPVPYRVNRRRGEEGTDIIPPLHQPPNYKYGDAERPSGCQFKTANVYGFHSALVPWPQREWNPIDQLRPIRAWVADTPRTRALVRLKDVRGLLADEYGEGVARLQPWALRPLFLTLGSWEYDAQGADTRWVNPRYKDKSMGTYADLTLPPGRGDDEVYRKRREWTRYALSLGLKPPDIWPRMGITKTQFNEMVDQRGWPIGEWREEGRIINARTLKTAYAWGSTHRELGEAFGVSESAIRGRIRRDAADYEPPKPTASGLLD